MKSTTNKNSLLLLLFLAGVLLIGDVVLTFIVIWLHYNEVFVDYLPQISLVSNLASFILISFAVWRLFKHFRTNAKQLSALDEKQKEYAWQTEGIKHVMNVLDENNYNLSELGHKLTKFLFDYTEMAGIVFFANVESQEELVLISQIGFNSVADAKKINTNDGFYGNILQHQKPILLTDIPAKYIIKSTFLEIQPKSAVILPLSFNHKLAGILEIAFAENLPNYKLDFLEKISEGIAATILEIKQDKKNHTLLTESQLLTENLKAQEEELRQNLEEIRAVQEQLQEKIVQTELIKNELAARDKVLNMSALVTESDIYGNITYANEKFCEVSQYTLAESLGKSHNIVRHPETPKEVFKEMWTTIKRGGIFKGVIKNRAKDGSEYWVDVTVAPIMNENGVPLRYIGVRFNITQQVRQAKQIQELLFESLEINKTLHIKEEELIQKNRDLLAAQDQLEGVNEFLEKKVIERTQEIFLQKEALEHQKNEIESSIRYAKRIQEAMLPNSEDFDELELNHFIFYQPRDIVSGDFYWLAQSGTYSEQFLKVNPNLSDKHRYSLFAVADCTGHGVPGAFMSMIGISKLNQIVKEQEIIDTATILSLLNEEVNAALSNQHIGTKSPPVRDGMDIALCCLDREEKILYFSGALNPLIYVQNNELKLIRGDKRPIGGGFRGDKYPSFTTHQVDVSIPTVIYIYSDGFQDQFGGEEGKKFMSSRFRNLLFQIYHKTSQEQASYLQDTMKNWQADRHKQIDDILVMGIQI